MEKHSNKTTGILKDLPISQQNLRAESKEVIKKNLNKILTKRFIEILEKEKFTTKEIVDIAQKVQRAGFGNINELMMDDFYFDLNSKEFKKILSDNITIEIQENKKISLEEQSDNNFLFGNN
jgi:hypothetical protein